MERDSSDSRQRILLITGMSGAGKTTALRVLEDLGWEAIDNFPVRLLDRLIREEGSPASDGIRAPLAIGFDTRTRGFDPEGIIALVKDLTRRDDLVISTLFRLPWTEPLALLNALMMAFLAWNRFSPN